MSDGLFVVRRCSCSKPHKDGSIVVRFVYASNKREWACRLCPHFTTVDAAVAKARTMRNVREIGNALTYAKYNDGRVA